MTETSRTPAQVAAAFDIRAGSYEKNEWHRRCAERLVTLSGLQPGWRVLDACTGTGFAALAAAEVVGTEGQVVGIDVSSGMLEQARKAATSRRSHVHFVQGDASQLPHDAASCDAVTCAQGLLYMDPSAALREWHRVIRSGGVVGFTSMRAGSPPAGRVFRECAAAFGVELQDPSAELGQAAACRKLLSDAAFSVRSVVTEPVEFMPQDITLAWESNVHSPAHAGVTRLPDQARRALRDRYVAALASLERQSPGELSRAHVLYAIGVK